MSQFDESGVKRFLNWMRRNPASTAPPVIADVVPSLRGEDSHGGLAADEILDSQALAKVGLLELIAKTVVDGLMSGKHRSTHKGGMCEFSDHRAYAPGDDLRLIDWRVFGKRDRYFVKRFDDETNLQAWIVVDASGSMAYGDSTVTKFDYARMAAACVGRLLLRQRDAIGLAVQSDFQHHVVPPRVRSSHFNRVCEVLRLVSPSGVHGAAESLVRLSSQIKRRGMVVVFSDCFGDLDTLTAGLQKLRLKGHDVIVFQILAPEEVNFSFRAPSVFEDLERSGYRLNVDPQTLRQRYLDRFGKFIQQLQWNMQRINCDLITVSTDHDLGDSLSLFLRRRTGQRRA